ncbi:type II toxin-antitoxin system ParD family antitoxin [Sphingomonas sp.]|uniref:ribbon-helix-helix domain-containing protein n=1 Tax=Sphingomonas sp. TaxID=28214 RepID=UPI0035BBF508
MATMVKLDDEWQAYAEELVHDGRFASVEQAVEAGLRQIQADSEPPLAPHVIAAIQRGLADADAGRVRDADEVFDRLTAKYRALARDA